MKLSSLPSPVFSILVKGLALTALLFAVSCVSSPPPAPLGSLPMPPEYNDEPAPEVVDETAPTEDSEPEEEPLDEAIEPEEPTGMHIRHEGRVVSLEELSELNLPENTSLTIVVPPDTLHREVTDLLLQVHEQGFLIELQRLAVPDGGN